MKGSFTNTHFSQVWIVALLMASYWIYTSEARPAPAPTSTTSDNSENPSANDISDATVLAADDSSRSKREAIAQMIDMERLRNPCGIAAGSAAGGGCSGQDAIRLNADLARDSLTSLQGKWGPSTCSGMTLDSPIKMPEFKTDMSRMDKLKEIYTSLVYHAAYIQAITRQKEGSSALRDYQSCVSSLQNLQCSLSCNLDLTVAELDTIIASAGAISVTMSQDSSSQTLRDCLVVESAVKLLDMLIEHTQG